MLGLPHLRKRLGVTARSRATLPVKRTGEGRGKAPGCFTSLPHG